MRAKILTIAAVALLVAAAIFLPEMLLAWGDSQSLDILQLDTQDEDREGFAESIQLSAAEKILLLRSGALTAMALNREEMTHIAGNAAGEDAVIFYESAGGVQELPPSLKAVTEEEFARFTEEALQLWQGRVASAGTEIRALQALGGLPEIWQADNLPDYTGYGDWLYLDPSTYISFQVYQLSLYWENYSLRVTVDAQSERILSFTLQWTRGAQPNWGPRGASSFGGAWRDYWRMDSVATGWYDEHTRNILENVEAQTQLSGDYAAYNETVFLYDGQALSIPLECQGSRAGNFSLIWN